MLISAPLKFFKHWLTVTKKKKNINTFFFCHILIRDALGYIVSHTTKYRLSKMSIDI